MSDDLQHAIRRAVDSLERGRQVEDCLTIKEFAARVRMSPSAVREAIVAGRLNASLYRAEQVTDKTWRIYVRRAA